jgi:hypothetical protein
MTKPRTTPDDDDPVIAKLARFKHILINAFVLWSLGLAILTVTVVEAAALYKIALAEVQHGDNFTPRPETPPAYHQDVAAYVYGCLSDELMILLDEEESSGTTFAIYSPQAVHCFGMPERWCTVTMTEADGRRHSVDVLASSTCDAAHLFVTHAHNNPDSGLPRPTLSTVFEVVIDGKVHRVEGATLQRWIERRRFEWRGPRGYLFSQRPTLK